VSEPDWEAEGLLGGLEGKDREARSSLLGELHSAGVSLEELRSAVADERLIFLPVERALGEEPRYSPRQIAEETGLDFDFLTRQWQALGLPVRPDDEIAYSERDLEAARRLKGFLDVGLPEDGVIEMARVLGQSMARVAEASRFLIGTTLLSPGSTEYDIARQGMYARPLVDLMEPTLAYVFGMQLMEQVRHEVFDRTARERGPLGAREVTICFADIVGWTELSEEAEEDTIGSVADRLAAMTTDLVRPPVRVVKMIGDAAMLVSPEEGPLLELALDLVAAAEADDGFPEMRAGLASGMALSRWGDWYGRPVNLASRVCSRARPGSVLVTREVLDACGPNGYRFSAAGEKRLKGIGVLPLWRARRDS
jgi:adenylate cyclase